MLHPPQFPRISILYVDDEKDNLFVFKANFSRKFDVITSLSPVSALEQLELHHDDIIAVISDMKMPVMSGLEFIRQAKEKYQNIFYFLLTGYGYDEEIQHALKDELILSCFHKPFDVEEIEEAVMDAARQLRGE